MKFSEGRASDGGARPHDSVPVPVAEGELLAGKYLIEKVIGHGGMGVVVAATNVDLDQRVAIKFLRPHAAGDASTVARFAREARALAKIESEHVAHVLDVGTVEGTGEPYMVLECLVGRNLADVLAIRGTLEVGEAVAYILEACKVMSEAHGLGIIHRDLKPENLFLAIRADGSRIIKVIDFGISKMSCEPSAVSNGQEALTTATTVVGSPLYMSPEQLRAARNVDPRSDIWSLGVTLYELLTGEGPFRWSTVPELCAAVLKEPPRPLRDLRPDAPEGLEIAVMKCLEKDPARRFAEVSELSEALRPFAATDAHAMDRIAHLLARSDWPSASPASSSIAIPPSPAVFRDLGAPGPLESERSARRTHPTGEVVEIEPTCPSEAGIATLSTRPPALPRRHRLIFARSAVAALGIALLGVAATALAPSGLFHGSAPGAALAAATEPPVADSPPATQLPLSADSPSAANSPSAADSPSPASSSSAADSPSAVDPSARARAAPDPSSAPAVKAPSARPPYRPPTHWRHPGRAFEQRK